MKKIYIITIVNRKKKWKNKNGGRKIKVVNEK